MRRPSREINIFNLSMLDVIAGAMGAFLIIMIVLLPYYGRLPIEYKAMVDALRAQLVESVRRTEAAEAAATASRQLADAAQAEARAAREEAQKAQARADSLEKKDLDLVIVLDTTGSMQPQIASLQADIKGLVRILDALSKRLRVGMVVYRDDGAPSYVTKSFDLVPTDVVGMGRLEGFVDALDTGSGLFDTTREERVERGLAEATRQNWDPNAEGIIVVIGDNRAHPGEVDRAYRTATEFASRSEKYRVSTITPAGVSHSVADFYDKLAQYGNGAYITGTTELLSSIIVSIFKE